MLKYTSMNLEKKRELNKAHEANARAAKKASLKRKLDSPTPSGPGGETQGLHGENYHFRQGETKYRASVLYGTE